MLIFKDNTSKLNTNEVRENLFPYFELGPYSVGFYYFLGLLVSSQFPVALVEPELALTFTSQSLFLILVFLLLVLLLERLVPVVDLLFEFTDAPFALVLPEVADSTVVSVLRVAGSVDIELLLPDVPVPLDDGSAGVVTVELLPPGVAEVLPPEFVAPPKLGIAYKDPINNMANIDKAGLVAFIIFSNNKNCFSYEI